jgi:hypothetical protein
MIEILKKEKTWISKKCKSRLKMQNPELFEFDFKAFLFKFKIFIAKKNSWIYLVPLMALLFYFCFFDISFIPIIFNYNVEKVDDIAKILDSRIQNFATIISVAFVIIGLIINNLSIKQRDTYALLNEITFLYPILYYSMFLLGFMLLFSHLRDTINVDVLIRSLSLSFWLILFSLLMIAILFLKIILVTDPVKITNHILEKLFFETKNIIVRDFSEKFSRIIYIEELNKTNAKLLKDNNQLINTICLYEIQENKFIKDINVYGIMEYIKSLKSKQNLIYEPISINNFTTSTQKVFYSNVDIKNFSERIKKYIQISNNSDNVNSIDDIFKNLYDKQRFAIENNSQELQDLILKSIDKINFIYNEIISI